MIHSLNTKNTTSTYDVAIIGAGIAGSLCANLLNNAGYKVCVLEKSRGTGGRVGSKRRDNKQGCDLGAPYIRAAQTTTQAILASLEEIGVASKWSPEPLKTTKNNAQLYVGNPTMSAITRHWLESIDLISNTRIHYIERLQNGNETGWLLHNNQLTKSFFAKYIVIATPAPQAAILLANTLDTKSLLRKTAQAGQTYEAQWAMWVETDKTPLPSIVEVKNSPLSRLIKDNDKPNRDNQYHDVWVLQSTPEWAQQNLNNDDQDITNQLLGAFEEHTKLKPKCYGEPHRWLLSRSQAINENTPYLWHQFQALRLIEDSHSQGDAEGAILSASALSDHLINELSE